MIKNNTTQGDSLPATTASAELEKSGVAIFEPEEGNNKEKENLNSTMLSASFNKYSVDQLLLNSMHSANSAAALSLNKTSDVSANFTANTTNHLCLFSEPVMKGNDSADEDYENSVAVTAKTANAPGKKAKRTRIKFRKEIIQKLEAIFAVNNFPDAKMREQIGLDLNIPTKNLQVWFKNKRAKFRKNQKEYYRNSSAKYAINCQGDQSSLLMFRPGQIFNLPVDTAPIITNNENLKLGCDNNNALFTNEQQQALFNYGNYLFSNAFNNVNVNTIANPVPQNTDMSGDMNVGQLMERMMYANGRGSDFNADKNGYQLFQNVLEDGNKTAVMNYLYSLPSPNYFGNQNIVNTINAYDSTAGFAAPIKAADEPAITPSFVQFDPRALFSLPEPDFNNSNNANSDSTEGKNKVFSRNIFNS